ncbi:hypothetical protein RB595_002717 [Gaeumannomyces hyphopodioides]
MSAGMGANHGGKKQLTYRSPGILPLNKPAAMHHLALIVAMGAVLALALPRGSSGLPHDINNVEFENLDAANYGDYGDYGSYGTYDNYGAIVGGEPPVPADTIIVTVPVAGSVSTATATTTVASLTVVGTAPTAASTVTVANITLTTTALTVLGTGAAGIVGNGGTGGHGTGVVNTTLPAGATVAGNGSWSFVTVTVDPKTVFFGNATTSTVTVTAPSSKTVVVRLARVQ